VPKTKTPTPEDLLPDSLWDETTTEIDPELKALGQKALAEMLRRSNERSVAPKFQHQYTPQQIKDVVAEKNSRRAFGEILQASGDKVLSPLGAAFQREDPDKFEADQARQNQVVDYQQLQADQAANSNRSLAGVGPLIKALGGTPQMKRVIPSTQQDAMTMGHGIVVNLKRFIEQNDPGDSQALANAIRSTGASVEKLEDVSNWIARNGIASFAGHPELEKQARYWADLNSVLIAPWRNKTFGATLTPNEQAAFADMLGMSPASPPSMIKARLSDIRAEYLRGSRDRVSDWLGVYGTGHAAWLHKLWGEDLREVSDRRSYTNDEDGDPADSEDSGDIDTSTRHTGAAPAPAVAKPTGAPRVGTVIQHNGISARVIEE